jgi:peptide/nickel transport system substrate-binding protein
MNPKWRNVIVIVLVVVVVISGIGIYLQVQANSSGACGLSSTNPIRVDQAEETDTADPQVSSSTPDWGLVQQIYQTLVMYNQSSLTNFTGVLAKNWTTSSDGLNWNFTLRSGVHFSNGDPFNAYVMWYSLYRLLSLQGIDQYLLSENFWYPNSTYPDNSTLPTLITDLNTFNFFDPTSSEIAVMAAGNQSFQVLNASTIELNLGAGYNDYNGPIPYAYLLAEMSTPGAAAVDPSIIDANGGINGPTNPWMSDNALGTGPYNLTYYSGTQGYTLAPNENYWATALAAQEPWNNNIQPAKSTIQVTFQPNLGVTVTDLKSGTAATASFAYFGPSAALSELKGVKCVDVQSLAPVFSSAGGSWWVFMNQSVYPFNNWSVRAAITHIINYTQIYEDAFGSYAFGWVGPVPPGSPYYNPGNLQPYQYDPTLAQQEIADSPCAHDACAGTTFSFEYIETGTSTVWEDTATLIQDDLANIGITVNPVGVNLQQFYLEQTIDSSTGACYSAETTQGLPQFFIGEDFYSSDYISPDDWTQQDFLSYGSANICNSGYNNAGEANYNASLDQLVLSTAGTTNPALLTENYTEMTELMYNNYTNAWFAVPDLFAVYNPALQGWAPYQTPMGSTELETMSWNTMYAT